MPIKYNMTPPLLSCRATTEDLISKYEEKQGMFMESTTLVQFKEQLPVFTATDSAPAMKIPVNMKLENVWGDKTLKDLTVLIQRLGVPGKYLHFSKVSTSSIAVHWLCPADKIQELEEAIAAAADSFYVEGVKQISIGGGLVLDFSELTQGVVIILCSSFELFPLYDMHPGAALPGPTTQQSASRAHDSGEHYNNSPLVSFFVCHI